MRLLTAFAVSLFASAAMAGEQYTASNGFAVSGYDVVAYWNLPQSEAGQPQPAAVPGRNDLTAEYNGAKFAFATAANRDAFIADPAKYAPQYDGHCALGVAKGGKLPGNPNLWRIVDGKLYLNVSERASSVWHQDIPGNLTQAESAWPGIEATPASDKPIPEFAPMAPQG